MSEAHAVVPRSQWIAARQELLAQEKELTRLRDRLAEQRRALPWVRVDRQYGFELPDGKRTLAELFDGRSQLVIYHFMFAPDWEAGCKSCSFWADGFAGIATHLTQRDTTLIAVSRAPLAKLQAFAARMDWRFTWASSYGSSFNRDFQVSLDPDALARGEASYNFAPARGSYLERPGVSVFYRDAQDAVFHTYSCYARGLDALNPGYQFLDLVPKGRDEAGLPYPMAWLRLRDEYAR